MVRFQWSSTVPLVDKYRFFFETGIIHVFEDSSRHLDKTRYFFFLSYLAFGFLGSSPKAARVIGSIFLGSNPKAANIDESNFLGSNPIAFAIASMLALAASFAAEAIAEAFADAIAEAAAHPQPHVDHDVPDYTNDTSRWTAAQNQVAERGPDFAAAGRELTHLEQARTDAKFGPGPSWAPKRQPARPG